MPEWLHTLYDAGMDDVDIAAMISIGVAQSLKFAYQERNADMMLKLVEWSKITDKCFCDSIDEAVSKK